MKMIWLTVAPLLMLLAGCETVSGGNSKLICPSPTPDARAEKIAAYLEQAPASPKLDVLAGEWERLDNGARICRGQISKN